MTKDRLMAFCDGCITIFMTIMVLDFSTPDGNSLRDLQELIPTFISYGLSFLMLGIYWVNHHHMFATVKTINGAIMWVNLLWLFFLSLISFASGWMGDSGFAPGPVALYGILLTLCHMTFVLIQTTVIKEQKRLNDCGDSCSILAVAVGERRKEWITGLCYILGAVISMASASLVLLSLFLYAAGTALWFIPDRRIEKIL